MPEAQTSAITPVQAKGNLADDLLRGADAIALFVFGDVKHRRKVYYYAGEAKVRMPTFRMGNVICARKSSLLDWIDRQERAQ